MALVNIALYCSKAEIRVPVVGGGGGGGGWWCKPIIMSNPQPSYFGLLLGWVAVAWLGFGVMTILFSTSSCCHSSPYQKLYILTRSHNSFSPARNN